MRSSLALLLGVAITAACGGRAASDPREGSDVRAQTCLTSYGCASGLRCDSGRCVPDEMCPPAQPPRLIFEPVPGSPWAIDRPAIVVLSGHELLTSSFEDLSATALHFHDLDSGEESTLSHPEGVAYCAFEPVICLSTDYTGFDLFEGLNLGPRTSRWLATTVRGFPVPGSPIGGAADLAAHQLPIWDSAANTVLLLDLETGWATVSLALDGSLLATSPDVRGVTTSVNTSTSSDAGYVVKNARLRNGAEFSVVYRGDSIRYSGVLLTNGEPRYAVRENGRADAATTRVERVINAVPTEIGTFTDPPFTALDSAYTRDLPLEPGPAMYALDCVTGGQCRSFLVHLDPFSVELIAAAPLPDGLPASVSGMRRLACGARDLVLVSKASGSEQRQLWSMRLPGRPGLP